MREFQWQRHDRELPVFFNQALHKAFQNPLNLSDIETKLSAAKAAKHLDMFEPPTPDGLRFKFDSWVELEEYLDSKDLIGDARHPFMQLYNQALPKSEASQDLLLRTIPQFEALFSSWAKGCPLSSFGLTSVGRAIGEARLVSLSGAQYQWVPNRS